jgi:hypothetical protein
MSMTKMREQVPMWLMLGVWLVSVSGAAAQSGSETFTATASVKTAGGASASAPVTITVDRKMPAAEAETLVKAFVSGGTAALRKALVGVAPTGAITIGAGAATPIRIAIERATGDGRLLTLVTDKPLLFLGGGMPNAKPKEGYDYAVIDLQLDATGGGSGVMAPAAKVKPLQGVFVVEDYGAEMVKLKDVRKAK